MKLRRLVDSFYRSWQEIRKPSAKEFDGVTPDGVYFLLDSGGRRIHVSHPRRLGYYKDGAEERIANLAREYCVDKETLAASDLVVDVGAHSGEFGLWAEQFGAAYIGIEPDPFAFRALELNLPQQTVVNIAVGAQTGTSKFSLATSTGDSSFQNSLSKKSINVHVEPLDMVLKNLCAAGEIAILKIEAEGFEPEVLEGALTTLARTRIVTVDAGEERRGQSTAPQCLNILFATGFLLEKVFLKRGIFMLRNSRQLQ